MKKLHYKVIYRNGDRLAVPIADFFRTEDGKFIFEYLDDPKFEFPGFDKSHKHYENDSLWNQISFRVPNVLRNQHPGTPPEELLKLTEGKIVTDHFEFAYIEDVLV
jgi:hypothetical protein